MKKIEEQEKNAGEFVAIQGDVDMRSQLLKAKSLHAGF